MDGGEGGLGDNISILRGGKSALCIQLSPSAERHTEMKGREMFSASDLLLPLCLSLSPSLVAVRSFHVT